MSGWWGRDAPVTAEEGSQFKLSEEDWKQLYKTIDYNEKLEEVKYPEHTVKYAVHFHLEQGEFGLYDGSKALTTAEYSDFKVDLAVFESVFKVQATLHRLALQDHLTVDTKFPQIITEQVPFQTSNADRMLTQSLLHLTLTKWSTLIEISTST